MSTSHLTIYKTFDQQGLNSQYNNRAAVKDFPKFLERWEQESERVTESLNAKLDLRYGPGERQTLDMFLPEQPGDSMPVLAFFHGGYWQAMDKSVFRFIAEPYVQQGVMVIVPNYPLTPYADMDELVESCRLALTWIMNESLKYGADEDRIHLSGHSAGGHLVAMMMAEKGLVDRQRHIRSGCSLSGIFDLEPIRLCYLNEKIGLDAAMTRRNSPIGLVPATPIPFLTAVGDHESEEYHDQSKVLADSWKEQQVIAEYRSLTDTNHFTILDRFTDRNHALHQWMMHQIDTQRGEFLGTDDASGASQA